MILNMIYTSNTIASKKCNDDNTKKERNKLQMKTYT